MKAENIIGPGSIVDKPERPYLGIRFNTPFKGMFAFVGLGLGYAVESKEHGWLKWKKFVIYFLISALLHSAYDFGLSIVGIFAVAGVETFLTGTNLAEEMAKLGAVPGPWHDGMRYEPYIVLAVLLIPVIIQIRRSFAWEQVVQEDELSSEEGVVIRTEELAQLKAEKLFSKRKYKEYSKDANNKLVLYQNLLTMQKHTAK